MSDEDFESFVQFISFNANLDQFLEAIDRAFKPHADLMREIKKAADESSR